MTKENDGGGSGMGIRATALARATRVSGFGHVPAGGRFQFAKTRPFVGC